MARRPPTARLSTAQDEWSDDFAAEIDALVVGFEGSQGLVHTEIESLSTREFLIRVAFLSEQYGFLSSPAALAKGANPTFHDAHQMHQVFEYDGEIEAELNAAHASLGERVDALLTHWQQHTPRSEFDRSLKALLAEKDVPEERKSLGLLASAWPGFQRQLAWAAERESTRALRAGDVNEHVGESGQRLTASLAVERVHSFTSKFGTAYLIALRDAEGRRVTWKTGNPPRELLSAKALNQPFEATFTVKAHGDYQGQAQTDILRVVVKSQLTWAADAPAKRTPAKKKKSPRQSSGASRTGTWKTAPRSGWSAEDAEAVVPRRSIRGKSETGAGASRRSVPPEPVRPPPAARPADLVSAMITLSDMTTQAWADLGVKAQLGQILSQTAERLRDGGVAALRDGFALADANGCVVGRCEMPTPPDFMASVTNRVFINSEGAGSQDAGCQAMASTLDHMAPAILNAVASVAKNKTDLKRKAFVSLVDAENNPRGRASFVLPPPARAELQVAKPAPVSTLSLSTPG